MTRATKGTSVDIRRQTHKFKKLSIHLYVYFVINKMRGQLYNGTLTFYVLIPIIKNAYCLKYFNISRSAYIFCIV